MTSYGKLTLSHTTITGCQADGHGGGASAASCNIIYSSVDANLSTNYGAGLFCSGGDAIFVHSSVSGNLVGGGLFAGQVEAYYSTFANNHRDSGAGGAIDSLTSVKLVDSTVSGNYAAGSGGGVHTHFDVTAQGSIITGNVTASEGAGIYAFGHLSVTDTTIDRNYATADGGGVFTGDLTAVRSTFSMNAAGHGGGAYASRATITNSTISGNHAALSGGGLSSGYVLHVYNSTIAFNTAASYAAGSAGGPPPGLERSSASVRVPSTTGRRGETQNLIRFPRVGVRLILRA